MAVNIVAILEAIAAAQVAFRYAVDLVNQISKTGEVLSSKDEAEVNKALKDLQDLNDQLTNATQNKLRGTSGVDYVGKSQEGDEDKDE